MSEPIYTLEWRGTKKPGLSYADIETGLVAGDLHSLYKINVDGKWLVLRDFLEQQRALAAASQKAQSVQSPPAPQAAPFPQQALPSPFPQLTASPAPAVQPPPPPLWPAVPPGSMMPQMEQAPSTPQRPAWFWPVIIIFSTVIILLAIVAAYIIATSRSSTRSTDTSAPRNSPQKSSAKMERDTDEPREKTAPTSASSVKLTNEEIAELKSPYVVMISTEWKEPGKDGVFKAAGASGSGVHIKNENGYAYFVTNRHVVSIPKKAKDPEYALNFDGNDLPFEIVRIGRYDLDLAMLRCKYESGTIKPVLQSLRLNDLKQGQECVAIGNALGHGISITNGLISKIDDSGTVKYIRTNAAISSGNSGGGLFRTKDGALIGITTMGSRAVEDTIIQNYNLAIPMDYVLSDLFWEDF